MAGRLDEVKQDEVIVETYGYDDNGNRLTAETARGSVMATVLIRRIFSTGG